MINGKVYKFYLINIFNMESLEIALEKIEELRRDLSAVIVVKAEEGHYESSSGACIHKHYGGGDSYGYWFSCECEADRWIVDKPRILKPDTEKREARKSQLQQIYDLSERYSARYVAGRNLGKSNAKLDSQIDSWIVGLNERINATITVMKDVEVEGSRGERRGSRGSYYNSGSSYEYIPGYEQQPFIEPNEDVRIDAVRDAEKLLKLSRNQKIKELLNESYWRNELNEVRKEAGKALGYSKPRIWVHECMLDDHLITKGIIITGALGLGYLLYQYFSK